MKEALSLPCLYKVYLDTSKHSYHFTTSGGARYEVFFQQFNDLFIGTDIEGADIFSVSVNKVMPGDGKRDHEISVTVDHIVDHFFKIKNRILLYTCDSTDGRHLTREKLFNSWYSKSNLNQRLKKLDSSLEGDVVIKSSILFDYENDLGAENITRSFYEVHSVLKESKVGNF